MPSSKWIVELIEKGTKGRKQNIPIILGAAWLNRPKGERKEVKSRSKTEHLENLLARGEKKKNTENRENTKPNMDII